MTKSAKKISILMLVLMLVLTFSVSAFADDIAIQLDGENIQLGDVTPITREYRNYVPFRTVFEAMGADVDWNQETSTVTAQRDGVTVEFVVGDTNVKVTENGQTETIATDAASFLQNDYTYVPVRFAAQSLGANVGWDEENQTVIIIDTPKLAAQYDGQFTIMDKYLAYSGQFAQKSYTLDGDLSANIDVTAEEETIPFSMTGDFSGLTSGNDAEMSMTFNLNIDEMVAMLEKENPELANDAELKASIEQLKNIEVNAIANLSEGKVYLQMPLLNETILGSTEPEDVWFVMDYNELMEQMGMGTVWESLLSMSNADMNSTDFITLLVGFMPLDSVTDYSEVQQMLDLVEAFAGDGAFTETNNGYTSTFQKTIDGTELSFNLVLDTNSNDEITAYDFTMSMKDSGSTMEIQSGMDNNLKSTVKMNLDMNDGTATPTFSIVMDMSMNMQYTETTEKPATAPDQDATIIDLMDVAANSGAEQVE